MFNPKKEFSRFASSYKEQNIIQKQIAKELLSLIKSKKYDNVLELGSGSGEMYTHLDIQYDTYEAIDISQNMCDLHPIGQNVVVKNIDFDDSSFYIDKHYDLVISSSAIQWSKDIDALMYNISKITDKILISAFSANTFATVHKVANTISPIHTKDILIQSVKKYFDVDIITKEYRLKFDKKYDIFRYIKHSGVSGGTNRLSYKNTKTLINTYPLDYLEFEAVFFISKGI